MVMKVAKEHGVDDERFQTTMEDISKLNMDMPAVPVPRIVDKIERDGILTFTLEQCDVSLVNALRRILLTNVPICCIRTENEQVNQCHITENTSRLHNEFLKQRLSCIPIHTTDLERLPGKYELVLDISNDTDHVLLVTSEHFRIRQKDNHTVFLSDQETRSFFPPSPLTGDFIEFARLRPRLGNIPPEHISFVADFSVATAFDNAMFNSVSTCTYSATIDTQSAHQAMHTLIPPHSHDAEFKTRNFKALDAQRYTVPHSWLFTLQSIGVFSNLQLLHIAFQHLQRLFILFYQQPHSLLPHSSTLLDYTLSHPFDLSFAQSFTYVAQTLLVPHTLSFLSFLQTHPLLPHTTLRSSPHTLLIPLLQFSSLFALHLLKGTYGSL